MSAPNNAPSSGEPEPPMAPVESWLFQQIAEKIGQDGADALRAEYRNRARRAPGDDYFFIQNLALLLEKKRRPTLADTRRLVGVLLRQRAELAGLYKIDAELAGERELREALVSDWNLVSDALRKIGIEVVSPGLTKAWRASYVSAYDGQRYAVPGEFDTPGEAYAAALDRMSLTYMG